MSGPLQLEVSDLRVEIAGHQGVVRPSTGCRWRSRRGEAVGLVGESGSGKSMTLKSILGLLPPDAQGDLGLGRLRRHRPDAAADLRAEPGPRPRIGMIFQEPMSALNPVMRVGDQIAEGPRVHLGLSRARSRRAGRRPHAPGGHPRARAPVPRVPARVLRRHAAAGHDRDGAVLRARAILCDEPTTALDVTVQAQILRLLAELCQRVGHQPAVHHPRPAAWSPRSADRVAVMYAGRIVERGTVREVFTRPMHPYTSVCCVRRPMSTIPASPWNPSRARRRAWSPAVGLPVPPPLQVRRRRLQGHRPAAAPAHG